MDPPLEKDLLRLSRAVQSHLQAGLGFGPESAGGVEQEESSRSPRWLAVGALIVLIAGVLGWQFWSGQPSDSIGELSKGEIEEVAGTGSIEGDRLSTSDSNGGDKGDDLVEKVEPEKIENTNQPSSQELLVERERQRQEEQEQRTGQAKSMIAAAMNQFETASSITVIPPGRTGAVHMNLVDRIEIGGQERQVLDICLSSSPSLVARVAWLWQPADTGFDDVIHLPFRFHTMGVIPFELESFLDAQAKHSLELNRETGASTFRWEGESIAFLPESSAFAMPQSISVDDTFLGRSWSGASGVLALEHFAEGEISLTQFSRATGLPERSWQMQSNGDPWWPWTLVLNGRVGLRKGESFAARVTSEHVLFAKAAGTEIYETTSVAPRLLLNESTDLPLLGSTWRAQIHGGANDGKQFFLTWLQAEDGTEEMAILLREIYATTGQTDELYVSMAGGMIQPDRSSKLWHFEAKKVANPVVRKSPWSLFGKRPVDIQIQFLDLERAVGILGDQQSFSMSRDQNLDIGEASAKERNALLRKVFASQKKYKGQFRAPGKEPRPLNIMIRQRSARSAEIEVRLYGNSSWIADFTGTYDFDSKASVHWPIRVIRTKSPKTKLPGSVVFGSKNAVLYLRLGEDGKIHGYSDGELYEFRP